MVITIITKYATTARVMVMHLINHMIHVRIGLFGCAVIVMVMVMVITYLATW